MRILVAEDETVTYKLLITALEKWGYQVEGYRDGESAWKALQAANSPKLLLLDWMMPGRTGVEICRWLDTFGQQKLTYKIILTGKSDKEDLIEAMNAGADDFVSKPFNRDELQARLKAGARVIQSAERLEIINTKLIELSASLEQQVKDRTADLEKALDVAEHASRMKSSFLANMSHEIRTPLNGIVSYTELLLMSQLTPEQQEDLLTIKSSVFSLKTIINDILDFSKIEAGKMLIDASFFSLNAALKETANILKQLFAEKDQVLVLEVAKDVPDEIKGDRVRIQQIITNLLGNATKFCLEGGAVIVIVTVERRLHTQTFLQFTVSDTGIGIPESRREAIFESFTQVDASTTRKFGGTGLGLTICRRLVELMGGRIWVNSKEGVGTAFHFTLPFETKVPETKNSEGVVNQSPLLTSAPKQCAQIILAEDNLPNQAAVARILRAKGYEVSTAADGFEVINHLKTKKFDLILMDMQMPNMGGEEATQIIRASKSDYSHIPILALSANAMKEDQERCVIAGMNGFVAKPIDFNELEKSISSLLSNNKD